MSRPRVLLVGWSGADWQTIHPLLDAGKLPVLQRLVETGTIGRLAALQPMDPALLWTSIATGRRPEEHGIHRRERLENGGPRAVGSGDRRCDALWSILARAGRRVIVCNWPATHPAEAVEGLLVSDQFGRPGFVHPPGRAATLEALRIEPRDIDAATLRLLVPNAAEVDQERDGRLARLAGILAANFNVHSAFTWGLEHEDWDFAAAFYPAIHQASLDFAPYEMPLRPGVREEDVRIFGDVLENVYRLHDAMLGRLLQLAGPGTTTFVVSEHGFRRGDERPDVLPESEGQAMLWRRPYGLLAAAGPGIDCDTLRHGGSLLDLAPMILQSFGIPFESTDVEWEKDLIGADVEWEWNRARSLLDGGRVTDAMEILDALVELDPEREEFRAVLVLTFLQAGLLDEAREMLDLCEERPAPPFQLLRAELYRSVGRVHESRELLVRAAEIPDLPPALAAQLGAAFLRMRSFARAGEIFARLLREGQRPAVALAGLSYCRVRRGSLGEAEELARESAGAAYDFPWAHYVLGVALAAQGRAPEAIAAFETAVRLDPKLRVARLHLLSWLRRTNAPAAALEHHRQWFIRSVDPSTLDDERVRLRQMLAAGRERRRAERDERRARAA